MADSTESGTVSIRPKRSDLSQKVLTLGMIALAGFIVYAVFRWRAGELMYFVETFPVHLMLAGFIGAYLIYLTQALYHTLSDIREIICGPCGIEIHRKKSVSRFTWNEVEHVRLGDLYLKLDTSSGRVEIPFISRTDQRTVYRFHNQRVRFMPDHGRFLAPPPRP